MTPEELLEQVALGNLDPWSMETRDLATLIKEMADEILRLRMSVATISSYLADQSRR